MREIFTIVVTPFSNFFRAVWTGSKTCMKTGKETMLRNNNVPWKLYTRLMLLRMIVAEHFHLKRSGTDVIYEIPCCHDSNLQIGIKNRKCLERLMEVLRGGVFKPVKVKPVTGLTLTGLNTPPLSTSAR